MATINRNIEQHMDMMSFDSFTDDGTEEPTESNEAIFEDAQDTTSMADIVNDAREQKQEFIQQMTAMEKLEMSLPSVSGLEKHNNAMDQISEKALDSYTDLMNVGMSASDRAASEMFGAASQMLKIALQARDSKADKHLKTLEILLKKAKLDKDINPEGDHGGTTGSVQIFDRNALLAMMRDAPDGEITEIEDEEK